MLVLPSSWCCLFMSNYKGKSSFSPPSIFFLHYSRWRIPCLFLLFISSLIFPSVIASRPPFRRGFFLVSTSTPPDVNKEVESDENPLAYTKSRLLLPLAFLQLGSPASEKMMRDEVTRILTDICTNPQYRFLQCHRKSSNEFYILTGTFGGGVKANLLNNPERFGVKVYQNCRGVKRKYYLPEFSPSCQLVPQPVVSEVIPIFLKIIQSSADYDLRKFQKTVTLTALQTEIQRARVTARNSIDRHPIGPNVYDLQLVQTNAMHPIQKKAYFQELLNGNNCNELSSELHKLIGGCLFGNLQRVASKYVAWKERNSVEGWNVVLRAVERTKVELWMRARLRLRLIESFLLAADKLWRKGLLHCDLHTGNIFHLKSYVTNLEDLIRLFKDGSALFPSILAFYSEERQPPMITRELQRKHSDGNVGIAIFPLFSEHVRFIDTAYLAKADDVPFVCGCQRPARNEDIYDLWRGLEYLLARPRKYPVEYISYASRRLSELYGGIWQTLLSDRADLVQDIYQTVEAIYGLFETLLTKLSAVEEAKACRDPAVVKPMKYEADEDARCRIGNQAVKSQKISIDCRPNTMIVGNRKWRILVREAALQIPIAARRHFAFENNL